MARIVSGDSTKVSVKLRLSHGPSSVGQMDGMAPGRTMKSEYLLVG